MKLVESVQVEPLLLPQREAAAYLSISERMLYQLAKDGEIPRVKLKTKVLFDRRDLIAYVDHLKGVGADGVTEHG